MEVTVEQVKELRNKTGAGMMDCKKALMESEGDFDKAIEYLRKKGSVTSQKRSGRIAKEGLIIARTNDDRSEAVVAEVNSETDFVARSADFQQFTNSVIDVLIATKDNDLKALLSQTVEGRTLQQALDELTGKVGEKTELKRALYLKSDKGFFCAYNHIGNKLATIIELSGELTEAGTKLGNDLAMQVAAMKPIAIDRSEISQDIINKEKDIYLTLARNEKKPENIVEKIANNKLEKFFQENCLLEQEFVVEPGKSVTEHIKEISKQAGHEYQVLSMIRFQLGETLES